MIRSGFRVPHDREKTTEWHTGGAFDIGNIGVPATSCPGGGMPGRIFRNSLNFNPNKQ